MIESQGIVIDRHSHRAFYRDDELPLTPTEFRLLEVLIRQAGRAFTRFELMDAAIGEDAIVLERTIDVHIKSLQEEARRGRRAYRNRPRRRVSVPRASAGEYLTSGAIAGWPGLAWPDRSRGAGRSGTSSARTTVTSRGASIPSRTCPPSSRTTVTQMSSPMKSFSMSFRVSTSMSCFLTIRPGALQPTFGFIGQHVSRVPGRGAYYESRSRLRQRRVPGLARIGAAGG